MSIIRIRSRKIDETFSDLSYVFMCFEPWMENWHETLKFKSKCQNNLVSSDQWSTYIFIKFLSLNEWIITNLTLLLRSAVNNCFPLVSLSTNVSSVGTIPNTKTTPTTAPPTSPGACLVVQGPGAGKPCVFPFLWRYDNVQYNGCAFEQSRDISPWCSTKVSSALRVPCCDNVTIRQWTECTSLGKESGATAVTPAPSARESSPLQPPPLHPPWPRAWWGTAVCTAPGRLPC